MWTSVSPCLNHARHERVLRRTVDEGHALVDARQCHDVAAQVDLKAKFEGGSSCYSFKRLVPGSFNMGVIGSTYTTPP